LTVDLTYSGSSSAPTNPGVYTVIGTVSDMNYQGGATNTLVIELLLADPGWTAEGQFQFTINTASNVDYTVESLTNLVNWLPCLTIEGTGAPLTILDPNSGAEGQRFYRLRSP
jgi:hypothetical protein